MRAALELMLTLGPPPFMVAAVFSIAYLAVGIPVHFSRGPVARDLLGTLAGFFAALAYITLLLGFHAGSPMSGR
jgi:hypothetical protein